MNKELSSPFSKSAFICGLAFAVAVTIGIVLRLSQIQFQILLDDEWHAPFYVLRNTFVNILLKPGYGANSIPYNIYTFLLIKSVGWSEVLLRLPSILAGLLSLTVLPWLVLRITNMKTALFFTWLLAISPFLIFYSRVARPYMSVALFGFWAIFALYRWVSEGHHRNAVFYALFSIFAVQLNLSALPSIAAPLVVILIFKSRNHPMRQGYQEILFVGMNTLLVIAMFLVPAFLDKAWLEIPAQYSDRVTLQTTFDFVSILMGTAHPIGIALLLILIVVGLGQILKEKPLLGWICLSVYAANFMTVMLVSMDLIHSGLVVSRYMICLFPLSLFCASCGASFMIDFLKPNFVRAAFVMMLVGFVMFLFMMGPLPQSYTKPNNFMNHSAFQEHYNQLDWTRSYHSDVDPESKLMDSEIPSYYNRLAKDKSIQKVIEYPMFIGDHLNLYYYYQHLHKKEVAVGYLPHIRMYGLSRNRSIFSHTLIDQALMRIRDTKKLRFKSIVNLEDLDAIKDSRAEIIIVHKRLGLEMASAQPAFQEALRSLPILPLTDRLKRVYGKPVHEDEALAVFNLKGD